MRNYFLTFFIFFFFANIVWAGDISQIIFAPESSQTAKPNEAALLTIQLQYAGDSHPTACMEMFTDSGTGQFSSSSSNWNNVDKLTINSNWASRKFYYKDSTVGAYTITIKVVSGVSCANLAGQEAQWTAEQNIIISDSISTTVVESTAQQTQTTTVVVWPTEPQIFADAGKDKTGVAGADIKFSGQSIGLNDKPLENARYIWTFGDGAKAEGKNVLHFYYYPGEYIAVLNIASGEYSASDRILVKIFPNQLIISETNKDYIKLQNDSKNELDISGWFLGANGKFFRFPETTLIKSNTNLLISSAISGLNTDNQKPSLFYPNGSIAYIYNKTSPPTPLLRGEGGSLSEPGEVNEIVKYSVSNNLEEEIVTTSTKQTANIITSTQNNSLGLKKWLMMIGGLIVLAVAGLFIIRRQSAI